MKREELDAWEIEAQYPGKAHARQRDLIVQIRKMDEAARKMLNALKEGTSLHVRLAMEELSAARLEEP